MAALIISVGVAFALVGAAPAEPVARPRSGITTSLIAYWKLEEASGTRLDELNGCGGSGCDLTDNNTVTQATGKLGNAAQFTNANLEYLDRADHADLSTGDIDFTLTAWVYLDSVSAGRTIASKTSTGAAGEYTLNYFNSPSQFQFSIYNGTTNVTVGSGSAPSTGTWYFVVAWHDAAANTINIQINNGTPASTSDLTISDTTQAFRIGRNGTGTGYMDGRIDAVGFWKKVLSADERTCLYSGGAGMEYPFTACDATATPTNTNTPTVTNTPTATNTSTATATDTSTSTNTPTATDTSTATPTGTLSPTNTPTITNTPTDTSTPTPTDTPGPTPTPTATPDMATCANPLYECHVLSSGNLFVVERRMTYGEIVIGTLGIALIAAFLLKWAYEFTVRWLYPDADQRRAMQDDD